MPFETEPVSSACLHAKQTAMNVQAIMPIRQFVQVLMSNSAPMRGYSSVPADASTGCACHTTARPLLQSRSVAA